MVILLILVIAYIFRKLPLYPPPVNFNRSPIDLFTNEAPLEASIFLRVVSKNAHPTHSILTIEPSLRNVYRRKIYDENSVSNIFKAEYLSSYVANEKTNITQFSSKDAFQIRPLEEVIFGADSKISAAEIRRKAQDENHGLQITDVGIQLQFIKNPPSSWSTDIHVRATIRNTEREPNNKDISENSDPTEVIFNYEI
jgi:hypothetical protein